MEKYKTIIQQYCPVLKKNIALEKIIDSDNNEHYECLNQYQCHCKDGNCINKLISNYNLKHQKVQ